MKLKANGTHALVTSLVWKTHVRAATSVVSTMVWIVWLSLRVVTVGKEDFVRQRVERF